MPIFILGLIGVPALTLSNLRNGWPPLSTLTTLVFFALFIFGLVGLMRIKYSLRKK